jgi:hypothetical protein
MLSKFALEKFTACVSIVAVAILVSGTDACQTDYSVGGQASGPAGTGTATAGPTSTVTPTETPEGTVSVTPETTGTAETTGTVTSTPTSTPTRTLTPDNNATSLGAKSDRSGNLLDELSQAAESEGAARGAGGNWLGKGFGDSKSVWLDSDGDGFSDDLEGRTGSDPQDSQSIPDQVVTTDINTRVRSNDSDLDGLSNGDEAKLGTNPRLLDSDGDGRSDGAEGASGGDPKNPGDSYADVDEDGLSDSYETENGSDPNKLDTDDDGLRDDLELVMMTNPQVADSDGDGISDGKEFTINSDPGVAE